MMIRKRGIVLLSILVLLCSTAWAEPVTLASPPTDDTELTLSAVQPAPNLSPGGRVGLLQTSNSERVLDASASWIVLGQERPSGSLAFMMQGDGGGGGKSGKGKSLMIAGGVLLLFGVIIGDDIGKIMSIGGVVVGVYGVILYF